MYIKEIINMINKERNRRVRLESAGKFVIGASIGAAFGILAGLLFAPKPGKETRRDLADTAGNLSRSVAQKAGDAGKSMGRVMESGKTIIKKACKKARKNVNADPVKDAEIIIEPDDADTAVVIELVRETGEEEAEGENAEEGSTEEENTGEENTGEEYAGEEYSGEEYTGEDYNREEYTRGNSEEVTEEENIGNENNEE